MPEQSGYLISERTAPALREVLSRVPRGPGGRGAGYGSMSAGAVAIVEITDSADPPEIGPEPDEASGVSWYEGAPVQYVSYADEWESYDPCLVAVANGGTLQAGQRCLCLRAGDTEDGTPVFVAAAVGAPCPVTIYGPGLEASEGLGTPGTVSVAVDGPPTAAGSLLLVSLTFDGTLSAAPTGWTALHSSTGRWLGWKIGHVEDVQYVWSFASLTTFHGGRYVGFLKAAGVEDSATATGTGTALESPSVHSGGAGRYLVVCAFEDADQTPLPSAPSGMTAPGGDLLAFLSGPVSLRTQLFYEPINGPGATGTRAITLSDSANWRAYSVLIYGGGEASGLTWSGDLVVCGKIHAIRDGRPPTITDPGYDLMTAASAGDQRAFLGLGSLALQSSSSVSITGGSISGSVIAGTVKLDDWAAPDDNTDLNASTSAHGLLKKLSDVSTEYLNGQGNWATPPSVPSDGDKGDITVSSSGTVWSIDAGAVGSDELGDAVNVTDVSCYNLTVADHILLGSAKLQVQSSGSATSGSIIDKWPIYDSGGTLIGYVPIYDS